MKRFEFKLQRLLDLRIAEEKEIQRKLAELISSQNAERLRQEEYRQRVSSERIKFSDKLKNEVYTYNDIMNFQRFKDSSFTIIKSLNERINSYNPEIQRIRDQLNEASKKRKVVEHLRDKRWKEYLIDLNREIIKENDDSNQKLYSRRGTEGEITRRI
ncbi:MAG: flagellar FliJ family protein [Spirochaetota bacterium]|nr:flagellar FliJ family protein [Spirochaetota bacterium]